MIFRKVEYFFNNVISNFSVFNSSFAAFRIEISRGDRMVKLFFDINFPITMKRKREYSREKLFVQKKKKKKREDLKFAELHEEVAKS